MEAQQILATGGASGIVMTIVFVLYKFLKHSRCKSKCCGHESSVSIDLESPSGVASQPSLKQPEIKIDMPK